MASADYAIFRIREEIIDLHKARQGKSGTGGATRSKRQLRDWIAKGRKVIKGRKDKEHREVKALQILITIGEQVLSGEITTSRAMRILNDPAAAAYGERLYMQQLASTEAAQKYNRTANQLLELSAAYRRAGRDLDAWYNAGAALNELMDDPDVSAWGTIGVAPEGATARAKYLYDQNYDRALGYVASWLNHPRNKEAAMPNQTTVRLDPLSVGIMAHMTPQVRQQLQNAGNAAGYDIEYDQPRSIFTFRNVAIGFSVITGVTALGLFIRSRMR